MAHRHWRDLTPAQRKAFVVASTVQLGLAATAWVDLAGRPQEAVHGRKPLWAAAIAVNFVGPIAYLLLGRSGDRRRPPKSSVDGDEGPRSQGPAAL